MTLPLLRIIPKVYMDTGVQGAVYLCEAVTYIDASHDTFFSPIISVG